MRTARLFALVLLLALSASACRGVARRGTTPPPQEHVSVGSDVPLDFDDDDGDGDGGSGPRRGEDPDTTDGRFELVIVDQNGRNPSGIPVEIEGGTSTRLVSDESGKVVITGAAGHYTFKVPVLCTDDIEVRAGGTGRFGIAAGQTGTGDVQAHWRARYGPWPPALSSKGPRWPVGEVIEVRYDVIDRCPDGFRVTDRAYPTFVFETSPNLQVVGEPTLRSDENGYGYVRVRCSAGGDTRLVVVDQRNPEDQVDLIQADTSSGSAPSCG